jgi:colanic acid biosynthesis glycosyl transferase WcaI
MLVETWPIFAVQFPALLAAWWRVPLLYYIKDVYPEAAEKAGVLRENGWLARLFRAWDAQLCRSCARVVVISESMRDLLASSRTVSSAHFAVIQDWKDPAEFQTYPIADSWRQEQNIAAGTFVAMFGGTMGLVSGADILVDTADLLRDRTDLQLLCVGEGVRKAAMLEEAGRRGLDNLRFLPFQPAERVPEVQAAANITLLTIQPGYTDASFPSKLVSYLAAGRPILCSAPPDSGACRLVLEAEAGIVVRPGDAPALAAAIIRLAENPEACTRMGVNARRYFETHFTLDRAHQQFRALLAAVSPNAKAQQDTVAQHAC